MLQERHKDHPKKQLLEEFRVLRDSGYWSWLPPKTQQDILHVLADWSNEPRQKN